MTDPTPDPTPSKETPVVETNPNFDVSEWLREMFSEPDPDDAAPTLTPEEAPYGVTANNHPVPGGFTGTVPEFLAWVEERLVCGRLTLSAVRTDLTGREVQVVEMTTGGYSDDEDFLGRIPHRSLFGWMFWESTHRGGLTVYEVPVTYFSSDDVHEWITPPSDVFEEAHLARTLTVEPMSGDDPSEVLRVDLPHGARLRYRETDSTSFPRTGELIVEPISTPVDPWWPEQD